MNSRRISFPALALLLLLACAVLAVVLMRSGASEAPAGPLTGSTVGGPFTLTDQDGRTVHDSDFRGRYMLVYFGYTFCPDVCPMDVQKFSAALKAFEKANPARAAKVQPIFITVDPARDTPAALKAFVAAFHPRLIGLTGSAAQIDAAKSAYRVYARKAGPAEASTDYLVDHTALTYLMGPDGKPISFAAQDSTVAQITADLERYVR